VKAGRFKGIFMNSNEESVFYNGQQILKKHFRVFIYHADGSEKLVNDYDVYQSHIASGVWFETKDQRDSRKKINKPKKPPIEAEKEGCKTKRELKEAVKGEGMPTHLSDEMHLTDEMTGE
jgi:hypothetical protein